MAFRVPRLRLICCFSVEFLLTFPLTLHFWEDLSLVVKVPLFSFILSFCDESFIVTVRSSCSLCDIHASVTPPIRTYSYIRDIGIHQPTDLNSAVEVYLNRIEWNAYV